MGKLETKFREIEKQKPLTMDFSSELARLIHRGTIPRKMHQKSELISEDYSSFSVEDRNSSPGNGEGKGTTTSSFRFSELHINQSIPKIRQIFSKTRRILPVSGASVTKNPAISTLQYALSDMRMIPGEMIKVLDEFLHLPLWVTMPVIFASSVILGAALSVLVGF